MSDKRWKLSGIFKLYVHVLLFSIVCWGISVLVNPSSFSIKELLKALTPMISGQWWFVSCYAQLFLTIPIWNMAIAHMDKKIYTSVLLMLIFVNSVIPTIGIWKSAQWCGGNDTFWFITLYFISAYIKKFNIKGNALKWFLSYALFALGMIVSRLVVGYGAFFVLGRISGENIMYSYNSLLTLFASISLFMCMNNIRFKENKFSRMLAFISSMSLGVYLWHASPNISKMLFGFVDAGRFAHSPFWMVLYMVVFVLACFLIGVAFDFLFETFYKVIKMKKIEDLIDNTFEKCVDRISTK